MGFLTSFLWTVLKDSSVPCPGACERAEGMACFSDCFTSVLQVAHLVSFLLLACG